MSVEALVLLALFLGLPLIQQLMQARLQRNQRPPEPPEKHSGAPQPFERTPPPLEAAAVPPLPDTTPRASNAISAGGPMSAPDAGGPVTLALTPHRTMERRTTVGLRTRRDLRRAIVLVAMLGPCRASNPYDWPEHTGRP